MIKTFFTNVIEGKVNMNLVEEELVNVVGKKIVITNKAKIFTF